MPTAKFGAMLCLLASVVSAQNSAGWNVVAALPKGADVRVKAGGKTVRGRVESVTADSLSIVGGKTPGKFDRQQISAVAVKKASHRGRNTLIGLGAGAGAGFIISAATIHEGSGFEILSRGEVIAIFGAAGAIIGTVVGVAIPTGGWRNIYKR